MAKKTSKSSGQKLSKREERRQKLEREKRMRTLRIVVPIVVIVGAVVVLAVLRLTEPDVEGVVFAEEAAIGNQHDPNLQYGFGGIPPMGGPHNPIWQNCGIYDQPVEPEYAVHSMEHGAVWITYHPELPANQVADLQDKARGQSYVLLSPYPDQDNDIVLTTWDVQLQVDSSDDERIEQFINKYRRTRGPEAGATCGSGRGTPIQ